MYDMSPQHLIPSADVELLPQTVPTTGLYNRVLIRPEILILPPTFQMLASSVVGLCATVEILTVIWERPGGALTRYSTDDRSELQHDSQPWQNRI